MGPTSEVLLGRMAEAGRPRVVGPHGRLGVLWAIVTVSAAAAGPAWLAAWLAPTAGLAAAQVARSRANRPGRSGGGPMVGVAGAGAMGLSAAAAVSLTVVAAAVGVMAAGTLAYALLNSRERFGGEWLRVAGASIAVGGAGAAPVLLRHANGLTPVLVLLAYAMAYDASTYVVGTGAATGWEGPAAGIAAVGTVTLSVAAFLSPPFRGSSPWLLGALAAVLAPIGPMVASAFPGDPKVRVPALRRLDSLLVMGPLWAAAATLLLD